MIELVVKTTNSTYPIQIGDDLLFNLDQQIATIPHSDKWTDFLLLSNETVFPLYGETVVQALQKTGKTVHYYLIPDGEQYKTWDMANQVLSFALEKRLSRKTALVALGGGVVGDLAGFVASIYLRGIPFIQIPTTLLAQVDSSVGGKVAVNHELGKNMIGSFYQPEAVFMDVSTLKTLPERELLAGLAEVIKYGIIWDQEFFNFLNQHRTPILAGDLTILGKVLERCCAIKAEVVGIDEREQGLRAILNYGHTVGHALERATKYQRYRHGEAVAIGMVAAALLAEDLQFLATEQTNTIIESLQAWGLPIKLPPIPFEQILEGIAYDKKTRGSNITFILPTEIGKVRIISGITPEAIKTALARMDVDSLPK